MRRMMLVILVGTLCASIGCEDRSEVAPAPTSPTPVAPIPDQPSASVSPAPATAPSADPTAEAPAELQARAVELNAVPWADLSNMKIGDEAIFLLKGQTRNIGAVYGSGPYTADSFPPATVVHAGLLKDGEWGLIRVRLVKHDGKHEGSDRNGVKSRNWGEYHRSYTMERVDTP